MEFAIFLLIEVQEVVSLQQLVGKFGEGEAVAGFAVEAALHAVLGHHIIDGDVLADFAGEVEEGVVLHPVVVIDEFGSVGCVALEVEEACQLCLDAGHVVAECFLVEQVALSAFARGVANHTSGTADECQWFVAGALEMAEHHYTTEVAYVKGICGGVNAHVGCSHAFGKEFFGARHHLVEHTAPL